MHILLSIQKDGIDNDFLFEFFINRAIKKILLTDHETVPYASRR